MSEPSKADSLLNREIGRLGVAAIAMNGVIGSGIFALPAVAIAQAGAFSPWMFVLCGVLILSVALTFARIAGFFDITGGPIVYTSHAFGRFIGFQTGMLIYISRVAAIAASANLIVSHAAALWPVLADGMPRAGALGLFLVAITWLNAAGVRAGMAGIYIVSVLKLAPLVLLILFGVPEIRWGVVAGASPIGLDRMGETMLVLMYAFIGFEFSLIAAGETRDARAAIPKALIRTVVAIAVCYALIQLVVVSVAPDIGDSKTPLVEVAGRLLGPWGALLLGLGVVFSISGGSMTSLLTAPRLTFALARDGSLPAWLGKVDARSGAPVNSILFCGALSFVLAVGQQFVWLTVFATFVRLVTYVLCIASLPVIERSMTAQPGQFRLVGGLAIPALALVLTLWLLSHTALDNVVIASAVAAAGTIVFLGCTRRAR
ncbi:MAG: amino acid permease [Altererythrobacter sp.]|nr:amino acid permease [Altererythrobacter sp.]